jgi:hypothetical protein
MIPDRYDACALALLAVGIAAGAWLAPHIKHAIAFLNFAMGGL